MDIRGMPIPADGSDRRFFRTKFRERPAIMVLPAPGKEGLREAQSYFLIGKHLRRYRIPVPEILDFDPDNGILWIEDLGDKKLHEHLQNLRPHEIFDEYKRALDVLCKMQCHGTKDFDTSWCLDTKFYDPALAFEKEALYFIDWFVKQYLGLKPSEAIINELAKICEKISELPGPQVILHRDFQSRNLLLNDKGLWIIDFQGARIGPLFYDLAALLIDPYVNMNPALWPRLLDHYHYRLETYGLILKKDELYKGFYQLALLRNLQILGAFSFLWLGKKKIFFARYLSPALSRLKLILSEGTIEGVYHLKEFISGLPDESKRRPIRLG